MASKKEIVLGLSFGHGDSSAALIVNGKLVAAVEEERFTRVKHYGLFPFQAIEYCLRHAKLTAADVQCVAIGKKPLNQLRHRIGMALRHPQLLKKHRPANSTPAESLSQCLKQAGLSRSRIIRVEHHLAHLMSARHLSPSPQLALMSFDGLGDFVSVALAKSQDNRVQILERTLFPHSLGFYYTAMTHYLGFPHFGDEFKVMGLSSYGKPRYVEPLKDIVRDSGEFGFELNLEAMPILRNPIQFHLMNSQPVTPPFYQTNYLRQVLGVAPRKPGDKIQSVHEDLAKSIQVRFEQVADRLLHGLHDKVHCKTLALAGGCAHNSVWVGKIPSQTPFDKVFVAPASHDAGISVGAAAFACDTKVTAEGDNWGLLGPDHKEAVDATTPDALEETKFSSEEKLIQHLVKLLAEGKIIGLFHGRMEFGPRALGTRSIICDPRGQMKEKLNARVKHRESFRPFAASVLYEHQDDWFHQSFYAPTMEAVFEVKESVRKKIPAVVHVDNTCRIQSITEENQPFYWNLIEAFRKKTGIPMLLNTSFNDCEPIVCSEKDAFECFLHCDMDALVIGNRLYARKAEAVALTG